MMASSVEKLGCFVGNFCYGCQWGWAVRLRSVNDSKNSLIVLREGSSPTRGVKMRTLSYVVTRLKKWVSHKFCI